MSSPEHTASRPEPDEKPSYRFRGNEPPAALAHLRDKRCWVAWDYRFKNGRWTKPPFNPRTGRLASVTNPKTWGTFDEALASMNKHGLAGVGLVLTREGAIIGIDLDQCISDAGTYSPLAAQVVGYGETYTEFSPSGEGIRLFARGWIDRALIDGPSDVEVYGHNRFMTVTGNQIPDTPHHIQEAPRTLARLTAVVEAAKEAQKRNGSTNGDARDSDGGFFYRVNDVALAKLDAWVPHVLRSAVKQATGAWRVTSKDLGRDYQEDLSIHPSGIVDFGAREADDGDRSHDQVRRRARRPSGRSAAVREDGDPPATLGWKQVRAHPRSNGHAPHVHGSERMARPGRLCPRACSPLRRSTTTCFPRRCAPGSWMCASACSARLTTLRSA